MDWTPYVAPLVTALIAGGATYAAVSSRIAVLETKMDDLAGDVRRHNSVVERTALLERDQKTIWREIEKTRVDIRDINRRGGLNGDG